MGSVNFAAIIVIIISINILLFVGGVRVVGDDSNSFLNRFVNQDKYTNNGTLELSDSLKNTVPTSYSESSGSGLLSFVDALGAVISFLVFLVNIIFTPIGLFTGAGLPVEVGLIVGIPLVVMLIFGIIYLIRSGS